MLSWADLVIEDRSREELRAWLEPWRWRTTGRATPLFVNRFGCWFLQRSDGGIEMLEVFFGLVEPIASSREEFQATVSDPAWQEVYLLSEFVGRLHAAGKVASGIACYALAPHPAVGGPDPWGEARLDTDSAMLMDAPVWQATCAQLVRTAKEAGAG